MTPVLLPLFVLCVFFASPTQAQLPGVRLGPFINPSNNHYYYLLETASWTDSEAKAVELGGHLVSINSAEEQEWVMKHFNGEGSLWIGFTDQDSEGSFRWQSGESPDDYTNWFPGEPNNANGGEHYTLVWSAGFGPPWAGLWNDTVNHETNYNPLGVVEAQGPPPGLPGILSGPVVNGANGHLYYLLGTASWTDSEAKAVELGGHLVTINDEAEQAWVSSTFSQEGHFWIGFSDAAAEGEFTWASGEAATFTNWAPGEPNDTNGGEDHALMYWSGYFDVGGFWNDEGAAGLYLGLAEVVPPPKVLAWGDDRNGQATVPPQALSGVKAVAAGYHHSLALKEDGRVIVWGPAAGSEENRGQTTIDPMPTGVKAVAAGGWHSAVLKENGGVDAWGFNKYGQTTVPEAARSGVKAVAAGGLHTVALKNDGTVVLWGGNTRGQLSAPDGALSNVKAIAAGFLHTVVLKNDGSVMAWGFNAHGQTQVPVDAQSGVTAIAAGYFHTMALKTDGRVLLWGYNGDGSMTVPPSALSGVSEIAAGYFHAVALKRDGTIVAWGGNHFGPTTVPASVQGETLSISAGGFHTMAVVR